MRIRKNAKLSPLLFLAVESIPEVHLQTHVCQLNQSPWDVIPLHQHATNQLEEAEDSFVENASLGDSIGAVDSVASMEGSAKFSNNNIIITDESEVMADKDGDNREDLDENGDGFEKLVDSSWKCKKQIREEDYSSFSPDHHRHRTLPRSSENNYYPTPNNCSRTKKSATGDTAWRLTRPTRVSKKAVSAAAVGGSNPYEFYYYSGFGPQWGKKRQERGGGSSENTMGIRSNATTPSEINSADLDYVEEEDDDDDEEEEDGEGDGGKKRMRKPVKARSLKSLM
ncbi:hypothetical protein SDJN02_12491, partial [Cucurbita argyrosperma subsp. argyrosperma]